MDTQLTVTRPGNALATTGHTTEALSPRARLSRPSAVRHEPTRNALEA